MQGISLYTAGLALLTPKTLLFLLLGLLVGITIGALPGLNVNMAVSIMLPLTFGMEPSAGILMLLGVYCGGNYGGSIAATLVNIPGTPSAVMTTLDAYPMAKQGRAGLAIGLATMASALGGLFSCVVLMTISPLIAEMALKFTSLEMSLICIFGISIMALVSGGSMLKGIMAGVLGLLVSCIGFDPITSVPRFTFNSIYLFSGIMTRETKIHGSRGSPRTAIVHLPTFRHSTARISSMDTPSTQASAARFSMDGRVSPRCHL